MKRKLEHAGRLVVCAHDINHRITVMYNAYVCTQLCLRDGEAAWCGAPSLRTRRQPSADAAATAREVPQRFVTQYQ